MLYFLALACLSTSPNWAKLNQMPAEVLGFWRLFIATLILVGFQIYQKNLPRVAFNRKNFWMFTSGFFFFLHLWSYKYAAKHASVSSVMVLFASNPIWASLGGRMFFKEHIQPRVYLAYLIALTGIVYMVFESLAFRPEEVPGNMVALISAMMYAFYMLTGKKAREVHSNTTYATYQYMTCALLFLLVSTINQQPLIENYTTISWVAVAGLVFLPTFLGHFLLTYLVKTMNIAILTCGKLIEPILASMIAYFLFSEKLSSSFYISFSLTALAVIILFWPQIKKYFYTRRSGAN